ncbi:MAG TPA: GtrA family protein [Bacillota bacterium]|nr:GtrA family protein [Bacillota bacterium]HPJ23780.1 GtrA family protein [Bacillota bacterium]
MNKIFAFIKKHFLTRKFLTFGLIGVANTLIHLTIYTICYNNFNLSEIWLAFVSNSVAFVTASVFSYFANAIFTFKPTKRNTIQFSLVMIVFLIRWFISSSLTSMFNYMFVEWLNVDYLAVPFMKQIPPLLGSALLIPIAYFALDHVFRKTGIKKEDNDLSL